MGTTPAGLDAMRAVGIDDADSVRALSRIGDELFNVTCDLRSALAGLASIGIDVREYPSIREVIDRMKLLGLAIDSRGMPQPIPMPES